MGNMEIVATFETQMPTGVTVGNDHRVFVSFPRWDDPVEYTVAEIKGGKAVPYPNAEVNRADEDRPADHLMSVQSVVIDRVGSGCGFSMRGVSLSAHSGLAAQSWSPSTWIRTKSRKRYCFRPRWPCPEPI